MECLLSNENKYFARTKQKVEGAEFASDICGGVGQVRF